LNYTRISFKPYYNITNFAVCQYLLGKKIENLL